MALNKTQAYQTYDDFKAAMGTPDFSRAPAYKKSLLKTLNLPEGTSVTEIHPNGLIDPEEIRAAFESVMNELPQASNIGKKGRDYESVAKLMDLLESSLTSGNLSEGQINDISRYLDTLGRAEYSGYGLRINFNRIIGYYGESLIKSQMTEEGPLVRMLLEKGMALSIAKMPASSGARGGFSFSGDFGAPFTYRGRKGTRVTDLAVDLKGANGDVTGTFNISIKTSATSQSTNIRAWTTKVGKLMAQVFTNDYFGYGFYRMIGRLPLGQIPEVARYVLIKNFYEALLGSGTDKISDFVVNGKLYSAKYVINLIRQQVRESSQNFISMTGQITDANPENKTGATNMHDIAISNWIEAKNINGINSANAIIHFKDIKFH